MKNQDIGSLIDEIIAHGATRAVALKGQDVLLDPRVRLKCQVPNCENYNFNLQCPPNCLSIEEFKKYLSCFHQAILVQVEGSLQARTVENDEHGTNREVRSSDQDLVYQPAKDLHSLINWAESRAFALGYRFASGFIGGCCKLCEKCVGPSGGERCRHPFQARPSMEAVGIDVYATSEKAGLPIKFPVTDTVVWSGLLLLE